jgi:hypothetical protein
MQRKGVSVISAQAVYSHRVSFTLCGRSGLLVQAKRGKKRLTIFSKTQKPNFNFLLKNTIQGDQFQLYLSY